ncbi:MAG: MFS transporter [Acidobacteriota bacterium]
MGLGLIARRLGAALTYRDYRVLWIGALVSSIGTWMQKVAQSWLVLTLTNSPFFLGLDAFLGEAPLLMFTLLGGVAADRYERRRVLLASQVVQMASAFTLAVLVFVGVVRIWHILALSFITGTAQAFGGPAYQSLLPTLVRTEHVPNSVALNSIQFHLARIIGPLAAGVAMATSGASVCFSLNGLSFLVVIGSLLSLRPMPPAASVTRSVATELGQGLRFIRSRPDIRALMFLAFCTALLGAPVLTLLPVMVKDVFHQDVGGYSRLMAFSAAGGVLGAMAVAWLGRFAHMERTAMALQTGLGTMLIAFALSRSLPVSYGVLFIGSFALLMSFALLNSCVQLAVPNDMRGRALSVYMMAFRGGMPLGSLGAGYVAQQSSAPAALVSTGVLLVVVVGVFAWRGPQIWMALGSAPQGADPHTQ